MFETNTLMDRSLRFLKLPMHLSKLTLLCMHGVPLKHGGGDNLPLAKIKTTKAVDLKLGTLIK